MRSNSASATEAVVVLVRVLLETDGVGLEAAVTDKPTGGSGALSRSDNPMDELRGRSIDGSEDSGSSSPPPLPVSRSISELIPVSDDPDRTESNSVLLLSSSNLANAS
jgi:hypothetical protein